MGEQYSGVSKQQWEPPHGGMVDHLNRIKAAEARTEVPQSVRHKVLDTALTYVTEDRQNDHGSPEHTFQRIADLWNAYLDGRGEQPLSALDVAMLMALLKIARQAGSPNHQDNYIDLAGYAACAAELSGPA